MKFSIRDLLWLMLLAAVAAAWLIDHTRLVQRLPPPWSAGPKLVAAEGRITLRGMPLASAAINVHYPDGTVAVGVTDNQGSYMLTFFGRAGALPGNQLAVSIIQGPANLLAAKYANPRSSPLRSDIPPSGSRCLAIDLK